MSFIETRSGRRFEPLNPDVRAIEIEDIAHALSHQCRFSGHTFVHYSVAEHSVRVSDLLWRWNVSKIGQLCGLLHDASEAYLVDLPTPIKSDPRFAFYSVAEARVMAAVAERFGLAFTPHDSIADWPGVRKADAVMLATEARYLMPYRAEHWAKLTEKALDDEIVPWSHETARKNFLARFRALTTKEPRCECGREGEPLHACPFNEDVNNDDTPTCHCCKHCANECARDI